mmetsp:Transcript_60104/g.135908  ORF Transcript_60104/g.135908 Transcript_60104/m.135908 type:complete len:217 (-) Transcript_60104:597-1247(-)|eukprot:CAMPEP_0172598804 /NCGR_PEP_ID=MMETSP1068-20121228/18870_1 /TAXON_ID=35684 /ORGANISM="Pseudopedinella elastica, Strain CCMP716" /LENGTH=216 /DNA_ID=CAMNT_0013398815 /DNA_START=68 /DNA_END=718 /DNA_ORIENTATION=+
MAFFTALPVFGLIFAVPPIDRRRAIHPASMPILVELEDLLRQFHNWTESSLGLTKGFAELHLVYTESGSLKAWWQPLSYMFVHGSYMHLYQNLISLASSLIRPCQEFGAFTSLGAFFTGGIVAALNSSSKESQITRNVQAPISNLIRKLPLPGTLHEWVEGATGSASAGYARAVRPFVRYVGCSAGVTSLAGVNLGISLETLLRCLQGETQNPFAL